MIAIEPHFDIEESVINTDQMLLSGRAFENSNVDKAIDIYLEIINKNISNLKAYDRIIILYRKKKDHEKELQLTLQAILAVLILGNKEMNIKDVHKIWEDIVNDLTSDVVILSDDYRISSMDIDIKLKFSKYMKRYFSVCLLIQKSIIRRPRDGTLHPDEVTIIKSPSIDITSNECEKVDLETDNCEHALLEQTICPERRHKSYAIYIVLLLLLIWITIEYPWVVVGIGVIILIVWSSGSEGGGNVRGHRKRNGTYVNSYHRRTHK